MTNQRHVPDFKLYRGKERWEIRPYVPGEDISAIIFDANARMLPTLEGGYIVRKPLFPEEQWYVPGWMFDQKFELVPSPSEPDGGTKGP